MRFRFCGDLDCPDWVLAEVATLSKMSSVRVKVMVNQILAYCLAGTFNYDKVKKLAADNAEGVSDLKGSVAAVHFMVTNAAKHDVDEQSLIQEIQQLGLPKENSDHIGRAYREHKDSLRARFADESYRMTELVGVDWRVDHVIASSDATVETAGTSTESGIECNSVVHLNLKIETKPNKNTDTIEEGAGSSVEEVAFELSADKLDILINELSTAHTMLQGIER